MEEKNHNHNGFSNGFLLGLLVGILATLLVTTKKGRELLKEFTEKGLDKFSDLENKLQAEVAEKAEEYEEFSEEDDSASSSQNDYIPTPEALQVAAKQEINNHKNGNGVHKQPPPTARPDRPHRFFKSKRS